jgi:Flp pilus assembly protein TadD
MMWRQIAEQRPGNSRAHYNLAAYLVQKGRFPEAEKEFRAALALAPREDAWMAHDCIGTALVAQGRPQEALEHHLIAVRTHPESVLVQRHVGECLRRLGRYEEAWPHDAEVVRRDPSSAGGHHALAVTLAKLGKYDEADAEFAEALRLEPGLEPARNDRETLRRFRATIKDGDDPSKKP